MKKSIAMIAAALLSVCTATLSAQSSPINDIEVKLSFSETPKIPSENIATTPGNARAQQKWLYASISYTMPSATDRTTKQMMWIDEMSIEVQILLPAEYNGKKVFALLSGKQIFWSVPCDGKKHHASLAVPPIVLARYMKDEVKTSKSGAKDIEAMAVFRTKDQAVIARAFQVPRKTSVEAVSRDFSTADKSLGLLKLDGVVLPREKTPWGLLDIDSFDTPKFTEGK